MLYVKHVSQKICTFEIGQAEHFFILFRTSWCNGLKNVLLVQCWVLDVMSLALYYMESMFLKKFLEISRVDPFFICLELIDVRPWHFTHLWNCGYIGSSTPLLSRTICRQLDDPLDTYLYPAFMDSCIAHVAFVLLFSFSPTNTVLNFICVKSLNFFFSVVQICWKAPSMQTQYWIYLQLRLPLLKGKVSFHIIWITYLTASFIQW